MTNGFISKSIIASDLANGEVTIELKLSNTKKEASTSQTIYDNTEIYIMMESQIAEGKKQEFVDSIENLIDNLLAKNSKIKIGLIEISGPRVLDMTGPAGKSDDSKITVDATRDKNVLLQQLNTIKEIVVDINNLFDADEDATHNNLESALLVGKNSFNDETNKILISLLANTPSVAIGYNAQGSWAGESGARDKVSKIVTATKKRILDLKDDNINFLLLRPKDTDYNQKWYNSITGEFLFEFDGTEYVHELYGTVENPTYGKMYSIENSNIVDIITENIHHDILDIIQPDIATITIGDYFTDDIINNFDFSYVGNPSIGTVTPDIDENTKSITWNIDKLEGNQVATLRYKLKIKNMHNDQLLNVILNTNDKVVVDYKDSDDIDQQVELLSSPTIRLVEKEEPPTGNTNTNNNVDYTTKDNNVNYTTKDNTNFPSKLPDAGTVKLTASIVILVAFSIVMKIKSRELE